MGSQQPTVSVIVPIHNAQDHLRSTLTSLTTQTLKTLEVVCVDDKSSDSSLAICREFSVADERISVLVNEEQMGVSATRNRGMRAARGEYIAFVDSDDIVTKDAYRRMHDTAKATDADIVVSNMRVVFDGGVREVIHRNLHPKEVRLSKEYLNTKVLPALVGTEVNPSMFIGNSACDKLFRARVARAHSVAFDEARLRFEDRLFVVEFLHKAESAAFIDEAFYTYIRRPESLQTRYNPDELAAVVNNQLRYRELFGDILDFDSRVAVQYRVDAIANVVFSMISRSPQPSSLTMNRVVEALSSPHVADWYSQLQSSKGDIFSNAVRLCINKESYRLAYVLFQMKYVPTRVKLSIRKLALSNRVLRGLFNLSEGAKPGLAAIEDRPQTA